MMGATVYLVAAGVCLLTDGAGACRWQLLCCHCWIDGSNGSTSVPSLLLFLQGLHLDRDIAALMLADEGKQGQPPAGANEAGAAAPAAANGGGQKEQQQKPIQQPLAGNADDEEEEEDEPESMVDFLLKAQLSKPAAGTAVAAATAAARAALAAPAPAGAGSGDPLLRCWHPVGQPESAVAHVAEQLRQREVGGWEWWQRPASCCPLFGMSCVQWNLR